MPLFVDADHTIVSTDSGIADIDDVKGKSWAVGRVGSGTLSSAEDILEAFGITFEDIKLKYFGQSEALAGVQNGMIDVAEVTNISTLMGMIEEGVGVSALPSLVVPRSSQSFIRIRPVTDPLITRTIQIYWKHGQGLSPAAQAIVQALVNAVGRDADGQHFPNVSWDLDALRTAFWSEADGRSRNRSERRGWTGPRRFAQSVPVRTVPARALSGRCRARRRKGRQK